MIRTTHGASTHIGQVRRDNEDAFVAVDGLYMVADGMGGHSAGEVASALTVATLKDAYCGTQPGLHTPEQVEEAIALANTAVFIEALDDSSKAGMGTTLTGVVVTNAANNEVVVVNVGDSRTYLWRDDALQQITKDHSHVQTLVDRGAITPAEARVHYQRNIVLRAIGIDADVQIDLFPLTVENGDRFIMCSDGLVDEADDDEIVNEIRLRENPQQLAERLVQLANDNGGRDNITVVVVDFEVAGPIADVTTAQGSDREVPAGATSHPEVVGSENSINAAVASSTSSETSSPTSTQKSLWLQRITPKVAIAGAIAVVLAVIVTVVSAL